MDTKTDAPSDLSVDIGDVEFPTTTLTKAQIIVLCRFASTDIVRLNLNQVWFQGGAAVATDGHRLTIVGPSETIRGLKMDHKHGVGVGRSSLIQFTKSMRVGETLTIGASGVELKRRDGTTAKIGLLDVRDADSCRFPVFEQVLPWASIVNDDKDCLRSSPKLNAIYLADAALAPTLAGFTRTDSAPVLRIFTGKFALDPIAFVSEHVKSETTAVAVVMPVRQ